MDRRDFAIGVLSTTAVILFVGLLVLQSQPTPVYADGMSVSGGNYIMTVGRVAATDEELVYVIDVPSQKIASYRIDGRRRQIAMIQGIDFGDIQRAAATQRPGRPGRRP